MPKSAHPAAKNALAEICHAENKKKARHRGAGVRRAVRREDVPGRRARSPRPACQQHRLLRHTRLTAPSSGSARRCPSNLLSAPVPAAHQGPRAPGRRPPGSLRRRPPRPPDRPRPPGPQPPVPCSAGSAPPVPAAGPARAPGPAAAASVANCASPTADRCDLAAAARQSLRPGIAAPQPAACRNNPGQSRSAAGQRADNPPRHALSGRIDLDLLSSGSTPACPAGSVSARDVDRGGGRNGAFQRRGHRRMTGAAPGRQIALSAGGSSGHATRLP